MSQTRRIALLLALVTLALYLPVAWFDFVVYDDPDYITENPVVQAGLTWSGAKWAFTTLHASNWFPLIWLSLMLDCSLFGLNPAGPHLVNALWHAANAALLYALLRRLMDSVRWGERPREPDTAGSSGSPRQLVWPCAFIAALFAWHPLHVESVAWVTERKDVLSTFFALLTLLTYAKYAIAKESQNPGARRHYLISLLAFALGLMSKPMLVTLPCVLLLLDFWPLRRFTLATFRLPLLLEKIPFFLVALAASLVTFIAQSQQASNAVASLNLVSLSYRLKNLPVAYVEYLSKTFWPSKLAIFYPLPEKIEIYQVILCAGALLLLTGVAVCLHRSRPYWLTGWLWFVGMLVPVSGIVQAGGAQIADRYSYLSSVGIFIIVTLAALDLAGRWRISEKFLGALAVVILLASVATLEKQLWHWQNSETLFRHALAVTSDNDISRNNLGVALEQQNRLAEAAEQYRAAARVEPGRYHGPHNLANVLDRLGQRAEALAWHRAAVELDPTVPFLHHDYGRALHAAGRPDEALQEFAEAARLDPKYPLPHVEMARIHLRRGHDAEAVEELRAALRIAPDHVDILTFTAQVLAASDHAAIRDGRSAFALAAKANLLTSGSRPQTLDVLGMACAELGKFDEAKMAAESALEVAAALKLTKTEPIRQRLELYQNRQPWRESFRATNAPAMD